MGEGGCGAESKAVVDPKLEVWQGEIETMVIGRRSVLEGTVCGITVVVLKVLKVGESTRVVVLRTRSL